MDLIWPPDDVTVTEANVPQHMYVVRRALGDSSKAPRYIVTLSGRGYQFIGDVTEIRCASAADDVNAAPSSLSSVASDEKANGLFLLNPARRRIFRWIRTWGRWFGPLYLWLNISRRMPSNWSGLSG